MSTQSARLDALGGVPCCVDLSTGCHRSRAGNDPRVRQVGAGARQGAGKTLGRRPIDAKKETAIRADLLAAKAGIIKRAAAHRVGVGTVQRIKAGLTGQRRADRGTIRFYRLWRVVSGSEELPGPAYAVPR